MLQGELSDEATDQSPDIIISKHGPIPDQHIKVDW